MSKIDVSIIVGCFQQEQYLDAAIASARNAIMHFANNTGGIGELFVFHDNCETGKGRGISIPRNEAIRQTEGEHIICLDADDMMPTNYVLRLFDALTAGCYKGKAFSACPSQFISGKNLARTALSTDLLVDAIYKISEIELPFIHAASLYSRQAWLDIGGYNEDIHLFEDWDFWLRMNRAGYDCIYTQHTELLRNNPPQSFSHRATQEERNKMTDYLSREFGIKLKYSELIP